MGLINGTFYVGKLWAVGNTVMSCSFKVLLNVTSRDMFFTQDHTYLSWQHTMQGGMSSHLSTGRKQMYKACWLSKCVTFKQRWSPISAKTWDFSKQINCFFVPFHKMELENSLVHDTALNIPIAFAQISPTFSPLSLFSPFLPITLYVPLHYTALLIHLFPLFASCCTSSYGYITPSRNTLLWSVCRCVTPPSIAVY